jgi:methyl-accepting chemotaxis protein
MPPAGYRKLRCLVVIFCLFWPLIAQGQDMSVPSKLQATLFAKILSFNRTLKTRPNNSIIIGILYQEEVRASVIAKNDFMDALMALNGRQSYVFVCLPLNAGDGKALPDMLRHSDVDILYVAPLRALDIKSIADFGQEHQTLTLTGVPDYVKKGIAVGLDIRNERPHILINLAAAKASGADFKSQLLKISTLTSNEVLMLASKTITTRLMPTTLRGQLSAVVALLIAGIAAFIYIFIPAQQKTHALIALKDKADTVAAMAAFSASVSLVFEDREELAEVLASLRQSDDVDYAYVVNRDGQTIASIHASIEIEKDWKINPPETQPGPDPFTLSVESPILHNGDEIGQLYLGISTRRVQDALNENRTTIALVSLSVFAAGLLLVVAISRFITNPLANIAHVSLRIAQGDLTRRTDETSLGKVGQLAYAFNSMIDRVEQRTNDLQREIQDRMDAELALQ